MEKYLGCKLSGGMVMAQPFSKHTEEMLDDENIYTLQAAQKYDQEMGCWHCWRPVSSWATERRSFFYNNAVELFQEGVND